jgi:hypothetical protein
MIATEKFLSFQEQLIKLVYNVIHSKIKLEYSERRWEIFRKVTKNGSQKLPRLNDRLMISSEKSKSISEK